MTIIYILCFLIPTVLSNNVEFHPLSDEFINYINSKQSTWVAGRNFDANTPMETIDKLLGAIKVDSKFSPYTPFVHDKDTDIPENFDAREQWPKCREIISMIPDQSACKASWAVAAASTMTDRRCIASRGTLMAIISAQDLLSCCVYCGTCEGGNIFIPWREWFNNGLVSGGFYNSNEGCKPYTLEPCSHYINGTKKPCSELQVTTPQCNFYCDTPDINYWDDRMYAATNAVLFNKEADIQIEITKNGPVEASFHVYSDFLSYKSGVYKHTAGEYLGGQALKIIGWGVEDTVPYWLAINSWNDEWGDHGYVKIIRGQDELGIEDEVYAGLPKLH